MTSTNMTSPTNPSSPETQLCGSNDSPSHVSYRSPSRSGPRGSPMDGSCRSGSQPGSPGHLSDRRYESHDEEVVLQQYMHPYGGVAIGTPPHPPHPADAVDDGFRVPHIAQNMQEFHNFHAQLQMYPVPHLDENGSVHSASVSTYGPLHVPPPNYGHQFPMYMYSQTPMGWAVVPVQSAPRYAPSDAGLDDDGESLSCSPDRSVSVRTVKRKLSYSNLSEVRRAPSLTTLMQQTEVHYLESPVYAREVVAKYLKHADMLCVEVKGDELRESTHVNSCVLLLSYGEHVFVARLSEENAQEMAMCFQPILEDETVLKLVYNCERMCRALFVDFGIRVRNFFDIRYGQVSVLRQRWETNEKFMRTRPFKEVLPCEDVTPLVRKYLRCRKFKMNPEWFTPDVTPGVWDAWPLEEPQVQRAIHDTRSLMEIFLTQYELLMPVFVDYAILRGQMRMAEIIGMPDEFGPMTHVDGFPDRVTKVWSPERKLDSKIRELISNCHISEELDPPSGSADATTCSVEK